MKKIKLLIIAFVVLGFSSCSEREFYLWSDTNARLAFEFNTKDSVSSYTFVYKNNSVLRDTVIFTVYTSGFIQTSDKRFEIEQLEPKTETLAKAIPGVHFVKFDDPEVSKYFVIKAGETKADIPIILLRDKSLSEEVVELRVKIKDNENFIGGIERDLEKSLIFSDILTRPEGYNSDLEIYYFGPYSIEKHHFMIEFAPKDIVVDDEFFKYLRRPGKDVFLLKYYVGYFTQELINENKRRVALKLDVLREAPKKGQSIGDEIYFIKM